MKYGRATISTKHKEEIVKHNYKISMRNNFSHIGEMITRDYKISTRN